MNNTKTYTCMVAAFVSAFLSSACFAFDRKEIEPCLAVLKQEGANREQVADAIKQLKKISDRDEDAASVCIKEIKSCLRDVNGSPKEILILNAFIGSGFCKDKREMRRYIDSLSEKIPKLSKVEDQCLALLTCGFGELLLGNLADAERYDCQCEDLAEEDGKLEFLIEAIGDLIFVNAIKGDIKNFQRLLRKMRVVTDGAKGIAEKRADAYATTAYWAATIRDWELFETMCQKSSSLDGGESLVKELFEILFGNLYFKQLEEGVAKSKRKSFAEPIGWGSLGADPRTQRLRDAVRTCQLENNFTAMRFLCCMTKGRFGIDEYSRVVTAIDRALRNMTRMQIEKIQTAENGMTRDKGFWFLLELMREESRLAADESPEEVLRSLLALAPVSFSFSETVAFPKEDAEILLMLDIISAVQRTDGSGLDRNLVSRFETAMSKMSDMVAEALKPDVQVKMAGILIDQSRYKEGLDLLYPILKNFKSEGIETSWFPVLLYTWARGCRQLGRIEEAEVYLSLAINAFSHRVINGRIGGPAFNYASACAEHALVLSSLARDSRRVSRDINDAEELVAHSKCPDEVGRVCQILMTQVFNDKNLTNQEKREKTARIRDRCVKTTKNPLVLAQLFYSCAKIAYENNMSAKEVAAEIEQYFRYQSLFSGVTPDIAGMSVRDVEMKDLLFSILGELNDPSQIDYWSKVFERRNVRSASVSYLAASAEDRNEFLPLMEQLKKYEAAQEILEIELAKDESQRDASLVVKATEIKRKLEQNFDLAKKRLSPEALQKFNSLLSDGFVIHPDAFNQLSTVLPSGVVCLQFLPVGDSVLVYMAAKGASPFVTTISLNDKGLSGKKLTSSVIKLRTAIQSGQRKGAVDKELAKFYDLLLRDVEPMLSGLKCKRLVVNSSGHLRYVPFAALFDGEKYLVEKYQVTNITGLDMVRLAKTSARRDRASVNAVVFADPDGSLPAGRKEGKEISELFAQSKLLVGKDASIKNLESMAGNVNFIHIVSHAVLDSNCPQNSFILFADEKKWRYCDMMGFCVKDVDSIALSACSTAVGEKSDGGEIEGMVYQLLRKSPGGSVLASFWKVDDAATKHLMEVYYRHLLASIKSTGELDRGGALREAQLSLLRDNATASPYYWAAFSLFGDFR